MSLYRALKWFTGNNAFVSNANKILSTIIAFRTFPSVARSNIGLHALVSL